MRTGLVFSVLLFFTSSISAQIPARARSCCGLMDGKIYCYGGDMYSTTTKHVPNSGMNVLDLTNKSGTLATELQNMWQPVSYNINNVDLTSRTDAQCAILEGGKQMLINGGYDSVRPGKLANLNIAYNVDTNQWNALPDYTEPPYGKRQIYYGSATNIPGKGVAFYGGYEEHINASWSVPSNGNLSVLNFGNPATSRLVGYTQVAMFQQENQTNPWRLLAPLQDGFLATELSAGQTSVFDSVSNEIIFLGGGYRRNDPTAVDYIPRPFNNISAVNVDNSRWRQLTPTGDIPQPKRVYTTATLLPSTNRHVLLFGGEIQDGGVCLEYCFTLNLDTYVWKRHVIAAPSGTILQRSRHSAVLVNNDTLFIMWGRDTNNAGVNSVLILNVSNPDNIVLSKKYVDPNAPNANQDVQGNTETNDDGSSSSTELSGSGNSGMSTGAKAGVAVACIVAAILGLASIWFCLRNKKNKKTIIDQQRELAAQREYQNEQEDAIPMEVDWDRIENKYTEIPPMYTLQNHANTAHDDYHMGSPNSFNMETLVDNTEPSSVHAVPPDGVGSQAPQAIESSGNDAQLSLQPMNHSVKPDGVINNKHTASK
ncbi:hypothetical protein PS6_006788 [Mucor atramentarius]